MKKKHEQNMHKLLRDLGDVQGIARMTIMSLNGFIESIRQLKCERDELRPRYLELSETIKTSKPKIIPLIHLMMQFEDEMKTSLLSDMSAEKIRELSIQILEDKINLFQSNMARVTEHGINYINNKDCIIVHSASTVVTNILIKAKEKKAKQFKVIILVDNPERTRQTIRAMREYGIEHISVPAYNLSHHLAEANKMFVGAMTITTDFKMVAPTGLAGTISLCRHNNIAVHLFASSLHYSHKDSDQQLIFEEKKETHSANIDFSMTTHSHDLVSLDLIDYNITENGVLKRQN